MKRSTLNLVMILVGMNTMFGINSLVNEYYAAGIIQLAVAIITYSIFKNEKNEQYGN
jgi:hypothetical protein